MQSGNFWKMLAKPIFALAPMADVSDAAFRRIIAKYGKPNVIWTEQVSCDGLMHPTARERLITDLRFDESERPIVAQFFGATPKHFYECAKLARELGFDGVDINMGCPVDKITRQKAGACLITDPVLAREVIAAAKEGASMDSGGIPVSVKTRIGYNTIITLDWISELIKAKPAVITVHGRTKKEMSKVPAHWDEIGKAAKLVHDSVYSDSSQIVCLGNGDVKNLEEAQQKVKEFGVDGVMIGRGIFGNPWLFNSSVRREDLSYEKRAAVMLEHAELFQELYTGKKPFAIMRKHFGSYMAGHPQSADLKMALMNTENVVQVRDVLSRFGLVV